MTGATSGIGRATAQLLAPHAEHLLVHGPEPVDDVASTLTALRALVPGGRVKYLRADYARLADVARLAARISGSCATELVPSDQSGVTGWSAS